MLSNGTSKGISKNCNIVLEQRASLLKMVMLNSACIMTSDQNFWDIGFTQFHPDNNSAWYKVHERHECVHALFSWSQNFGNNRKSNYLQEKQEKNSYINNSICPSLWITIMKMAAHQHWTTGKIYLSLHRSSLISSTFMLKPDPGSAFILSDLTSVLVISESYSWDWVQCPHEKTFLRGRFWNCMSLRNLWKLWCVLFFCTGTASTTVHCPAPNTELFSIQVCSRLPSPQPQC